MANTRDVPEFGMLSGLKVVCHGINLSGPLAGTLMAEQGATIINLESTVAPDMTRVTDRGGYAWAQEHRNQLALTLNLAAPEGRDVYFRLVRWADVVIESQKGGTYAEWGLTDDILWEQNPRLVIVHTSGFGQTGVPEMVKRPCYDGIGQAFGGLLFQNGIKPPGPPILAKWAISDHYTGLFTLYAALAGYVKALKTGKGESIDVAQFEVGWKMQYSVPMLYFQTGEIETRVGGATGKYAGVDIYRCADGEYLQMTLASAGPLQRAIALFGLAEEPEFAGKKLQVAFNGTPEGDKLQAAILAYCATRSAQEVEAAFLKADLPCCCVYNVETIKDHPHAVARELFHEWNDPHAGTVKGVNIVPKAIESPGRIWRGAPLYGQDNDDLLREFGYSTEEIEQLYGKGIVRAEKGCH